MATPEDLAETVKLVEALDRRIVARQADVRDFDALKAAVDAGVEELGRLDIVLANAGIASVGGPVETMAARQLEGHDRHQPDRRLAHRPGRHPAPDRGRPGRIDRAHQLRRRRAGDAGMSGYVSAKHGVIGLMRTLAVELGQHRIRVNSVLPTNVNTPMFMNEGAFKLFRPDMENPDRRTWPR